jgi:tetratricopeptide (TPR) repeat protein
MANVDRARQRYDQGIDAYRAGEYEEALAALLEARDLYAAAGRGKEQAEALNDAGVVCIQMDDWEGAQAYLDEALSIRLALPDPSGQAITLGNLGMLYDRQDDDERAIAAYEEAVAIFHDLGERGNEKAVARQLSKLKVQRGKFLEAMGDYREGLEEGEAAGGKQKLARSLYRLLGVFGGGAGGLAPEGEEQEEEGPQGHAPSDT